MRTSFFTITKLSVILLFILTTATSTEAQEYATDRLFIKEYSKTKCRSLVEGKINNLKINRVMTLEQEALLNQNVWSKLRLKLPLSPGEKAHLRKLKKKRCVQQQIEQQKYLGQKCRKIQRTSA